MAAVNLSTEAATDLVKLQLPRIKDGVENDVAMRAAYLNLLPGDTVDLTNEANDLRTAVANHMSPAGSFIRPGFVDSDSGFTMPSTDQGGQTVFTSKLQRFRGRTDSVDVTQAVHYLKGSLAAQEQALKDLIVKIKDNDVRIQLYDKSGLKLTARETNSINYLKGSRHAVSTTFAANVLPDVTLTFTAVKRLAGLMHEAYEVPMYGAGMGQHFVFIAGYDTLEKIRNESKINGITTSLAQGGFTEGEKRFKSFMFTDFQNEQIKGACDQFPLRFNGLNGSGQPILLESHEKVASDAGYDYKVRNEWLNAQYEIAFLVGQNPFRYLTPSRYTGEGLSKWAPQMSAGEIDFKNIPDNNENVFQDHGFFVYQIQRVFEPLRPHHVCAIAFKRPSASWGFETVSDANDYS